jgi:hypothetical protein
MSSDEMEIPSCNLQPGESCLGKGSEDTVLRTYRGFFIKAYQQESGQ